MKNPSPDQLTEMYAERDRRIAALTAAGTVTPADLDTLDRLGRFRVVTELWKLCPHETKQRLLQDQHAHVRSAAALEENFPSIR